MRWCLVLLLMSCVPKDGENPTDTADTVVDSEVEDDTPVDSEVEPVDTDCPDADGDGARCDDCDDSDPLRFPGALERCNGLDDNCDGGTFDEVDRGAGILSCSTCEDGGYWSDLATGVQGNALRDALHTTAASFTSCDYAMARAFMFITLDNDQGWVEGVYTGERVFVGDNEPDFNVMNAEHTWPGADGGRDGIRECDLHHLFPADALANNRRGSFPFGEVDDLEWEQGDSELGLDTEGERVFEPRASHRGNVARAMLYMQLRHRMPLDEDRIALFRQWHLDDPPDAAEIARSQAVRARQGNANPFVACPSAVERVYLGD